jgi:putative oxidoreductase
MTPVRTSYSASDSQPAGFFEGLFIRFGRIPDSLILFAARLFPAAVFWMSGRTKMDGWTIADRAYFLFEEEYRLPLLDPELAARLATTAEHVFPVLLVLGLASRFAALALLGMTLTIQVFVYPNAWPTHGLWATCFLMVIAKGPGIFSLDHLIRGRLENRA